MQIHKHTKTLLIPVLLFGLAATGCTPKQAESSTASADGKVEIDFWTFWGSETRRPIIEKIINDFNASQDKIIVKHTYLPWGDIWTKNLASIAAKNPADVIINDIASVDQRASKKQNTELTAYLEQDNIQDRFYESLWDNVLYEDKAYAIPFNTDTRMLYYNKKAFREAGLDPEKPPATWAELEEYAIKLDKKNGNVYDQVGFHPLWGDFGIDNWLLNADGGKGFFDNDNNMYINTPAKVEAVNWIKSWNDRLGKKNVDAMQAEFGSEQSNPFISGKVAMWIHQGTFATQIRDYGKDMEVGVAPIPEKTEGSGHYSGGGGFVAEIPYGAKHPDEAWEFIKYLTDYDAQKYWAVKNFDNVANKEAASDPELLSDPIYKAAVENLEVTTHFRAPIAVPDFKNLITPQIDSALLGNITAEEALAKAETDVKSMIQQAGK
ncbi:ABC transporter substrate-binding protein [Paenibacillus sp. PK3_47]|uniref:ABC transporter substrate-binding protein n=1 Tax=Paenibacillus sp. PK3_47 TaxID=2072642 RepID=UPI00201E6531|nr:ABC transporter substrate-binding protein [Paenibacillus sp. PK3_47]UQZ35962.1 ABC transporter substrate-binding protein [Paenibacillus sp. PK3_47]